MNRRDHWQGRYESTSADRVGWYRPRLDTSLRLIRSLRLPHRARVIDVGGGSSTLVDDLLAVGFERVTVLDLSARALAIARQRLGPLAERVDWRTGDLLTVELEPGHYDLWHDRAVFHFLTESEQRKRYLDQARSALAPGGHVVIGTFAHDAPGQCSGLPVSRYSSEGLAAAFGPAFRLVATLDEAHRTPEGTDQPYVFCLLRYAGAGGPEQPGS